MPRHRGTKLASGAHTNAPSSITNAISAISMAMKDKRTAEWHGEASNSNPCSSFEVRQWRVGYIKQQTAAGYKIKGAKELTLHKVHQVLSHLADLAPLGTPMHRAMVARDGFAFSLLWTTGMRGINACEITIQDFSLAPTDRHVSTPAVSRMTPTMQLVHGDRIIVTPQRLKSVMGANHSGVPIIFSGHPIMDPIIWLHRVLEACAAAKQPVSDYIVRTSDGHFKSFNPTPMTTAGMLYRLRCWLRELKADEGESMHSFRRGVAQFMREHGCSVEQIRERLLIKTQHVIANQYLPPGRFDSGTTRARVA